jgi:hypothetical protein
MLANDLYSYFVLAQDRTRQNMCSGSGSAAVTKHAVSILGSAFLCSSMICNYKILPNIIFFCGFAFRLLGICIGVDSIFHSLEELKNQRIRPMPNQNSKLKTKRHDVQDLNSRLLN